MRFTRITLPTLLAILFSMNSYATVDCVFEPTVAKVGAYGNNEGKLYVCGHPGDWDCYNLGDGSDQQAKNRYSTILSALASGKKVRLRFYNYTTGECDLARANSTIPSSTWIQKN